MPDSLDPALDTVVDFTDRGFPAAGVRLRDVGSQGWHALRPPMSLPLLLLKRAALDNNLDAMSRYCAANQLLLAPHGKTHMSPQLWREQENHGAWAVTVASAHQAEVYRRFGARRILIANELVSAADLGWLTAVRAGDPGCELLLVVDSPAAAERLASALTSVPAPVPQPVLIEVGYPGGRAGARDLAGVVATAQAVAAHPALRVAGIEGFEGAVPAPETPPDAPPDAPSATPAFAARLAAVRDYLGYAREAAMALWSRGLLAGEVIVTFGGSTFFDAVTELLAGGWPPGLRVQVVLRSGCYLTHDHGLYASGFEQPGLFRPGRRPPLEPALELWAAVLSCPEPDLAIVGFGRRDAPFDAGLPVPLLLRRGDAETPLGGRARVEQLNDQHAFVRTEPGLFAVGDLAGFGVSHPCTAFDKWRLLPVVDGDYAVTGAVRTYF
jgi:D-serine dehydratase